MAGKHNNQPVSFDQSVTTNLSILFACSIQDDIHYITQDSVKAKFTWEEYAEQLRRQQTTKPTQPDSYKQSQPALLAQLLSFSTALASSQRNGSGNNYNNGSSNNKSGPLSVAATDNQQPAATAGLMHNFTSNRFKLRFWQKSSGEKATGEATTTITTPEHNSKPTSVSDTQKAS